MDYLRFYLLCALALSTTLSAQEQPQKPLSQESIAQRLEALEREQEQLRQQLGVLGQEVESSLFGDVLPSVGESRYGLGPAASKVYSIESGLSIGGYGEVLFTQNSGATDVFDAQRFVTYFGYKYDEHWLFNSEVEVEHGSTSASSGTTTSEGSVSIEFGVIEYLHDDALNARAGLVLVPMGFVNELNEPTTFYAANRPATETRIIPSTWRALGGGLYGQTDDYGYRLYAISSLDGEEFDASGLRGGRQKGNRAASDDFGVVGRFDWTGVSGLTLGGSVFFGPAGQDGLSGTNAIPRLDTFIWEAHAEYTSGPWSFRALYAEAHVDDAGDFNTATGENLAERMEGYYGEVAFDVLRGFDVDSDHALSPYFRYEHIDTQAELPTGFVRDRSQEDDIYTVGLNWKPIDQIVFKTDYEIRDQNRDRFNVLMGFVF